MQTLPPEGGGWAAKVTQGLARDLDHIKTPPSVQMGSDSSGQEQATDPDHRFPETDDDNNTFISQSGTRYSRFRHRGHVNHRNSRYREDCDNDNNPEKSPPVVCRNNTHETEPSSDSSPNTRSRKSDTVPVRSAHSKAWKEFEYMRPIFIVPKMRSPNITPPRVRSVRTNQKTESVLDFFFKSRVAMSSPILGDHCYHGYDNVWGCSAGCLSWQGMLGLDADSEDQSWYTEPLDMLVQQSPMPSRRLYNRKSILDNLELNWAYLYESIPSLWDASSKKEEHGLDTLGLTALLTHTWKDLEEQDLKSKEGCPSLRDASGNKEEHGLDTLGLTALLTHTWKDLEEQDLKSKEGCPSLRDASGNKEEHGLDTLGLAALLTHTWKDLEEQDLKSKEGCPSLRDASGNKEEHGLDTLGLAALLTHTWKDLEEQDLKSKESLHSMRGASGVEEEHGLDLLDLLTQTWTEHEQQKKVKKLVDPVIDRQDQYSVSNTEQKVEIATDENENVSRQDVTQVSDCGKEDGGQEESALIQVESDTGATSSWVVASQSPTSSSDGDTSYMTATESLPFPRSLWGAPSSPLPSSSDGDGGFMESLWSIPPSLNASSSEGDLATGAVSSVPGSSVWNTHRSCTTSPSGMSNASNADADSSPEGGVWHLPFSHSESPWDCDPPVLVRGQVDTGGVWSIPHSCEATGRDSDGLGTGVWGVPSSPSPATLGRQPTPRSAENEVLDDRPIFFLPLGDDHDFGLCIHADLDSPPPIPPLDFTFTDSDEEDSHIIGHPSSTAQMPSSSSSHPVVPFHSHTSDGTTDTTTDTNTSTHDSHPHLLTHAENIWKCDTGDAGVSATASITTSFTPGESSPKLNCDTCESTQAPWAELLLSTSLPYLSGKAGMRSTYLDSFIPTITTADNATISSPFPDGCATSSNHDFSDLRNAFCLPLSPKHEGSQMSHLWDINAAYRNHISHAGEKNLTIELEQIRRHLLNLRFEIPGDEPSFSFIEGGLYGTWLSAESAANWEHSTPQLESTFNKSLSPSKALPAGHSYLPYDETFTDADSDRTILWKNFSTKPGFFKQRSTSADNMEMLAPGSPFDQKSRQPSTSDLLPSENSAFCDKIPPRLPHLPHVQSEPSLDIQQQSGQVYNHGRHVQVGQHMLTSNDSALLCLHTRALIP